MICDWVASAIQRRNFVVEYLSPEGYLLVGIALRIATTLHGAASLSLKALVLRGFHNIRLEQLELLANSLPELKGLWLGLRQSEGSTSNTTRPWNVTTEELAMSLSNLRHLEEFGCNGYSAALDLAATSNMLDLESNFRHEEVRQAEADAAFAAGDTEAYTTVPKDHYHDEELEAKLMACHLSSLRAFYVGETGVRTSALPVFIGLTAIALYSYSRLTTR